MIINIRNQIASKISIDYLLQIIKKLSYPQRNIFISCLIHIFFLENVRDKQEQTTVADRPNLLSGNPSWKI
jgi:hypothetical protein